jgi:phenylpyruvate tautomerase PptA (4-oxalocrotonate tautomerase family)
MPIVEVELVISPGEILAPDLAQKIADAAGRVLKTPPGRAWIRLKTLESSRYAENGLPAQSARPVFVSVLKQRRPDTETLRKEVKTLTENIAAACDRPVENVHVLYLPAAAGRAAFGGDLIDPD